MIKNIKARVAGCAALALLAAAGSAYAGVAQAPDPRPLPDAPNVVAPAAIDLTVFGATGCQKGKVLGSARVKGSIAVGSVWTTDPKAVDRKHNCSGGSISVRRAQTGVYYVRFAANPSLTALAISNSDFEGLNSTRNDNILSIRRMTSGADNGAFRIEVEDANPTDSSGGSDPQDGWFNIALF
jgi:hypothetical protein